ncbi:inner membrane transporter RhtA [Saccharopolyspora antimicrobica]|uniref:Inner membrane transporter RhtA n=1 Tax=Saccharopolyspora antimicrobica TaxID=455193 RepID=A0A1I5HU87_9PSEU|nr:inner membrane transporter RhtA [Saccharopolyspora antimicrobica]SFO51865.1 inner membrane transporter RhtA [Saccharopolyspora antimicrobica]
MHVAQIGSGASSGRRPLFSWGQAPARALGAIPPPMLVLLGVVSLQVGAAFAKQLFTMAGASGVVALRLTFAALILLAVWRPSLRMDRRTLAVVAGYGAVLAGMNVCIYQAFERIPLGAAVTIEFLGPLVVAVVGSRRKLDLVWAALAGLGVFLLARVEGGLDPVGVGFALAAGAMWAGYILVGAKLGSRTTGGSGLALGMAFGALVAAPFGIAEAGTALLHPAVLVAGLVVALMSSVIPYSLELEALRRMPPRVFGVLMSLEPAVAALAGLLVLGELLGTWQWVAIACVVIASVGAVGMTKSGTKPEDTGAN